VLHDCVQKGTKYALIIGDKVYTLDASDTPAQPMEYCFGEIVESRHVGVAQDPVSYAEGKRLAGVDAASFSMLKRFDFRAWKEVSLRCSRIHEFRDLADIRWLNYKVRL
jgi:hypothetical protein